MLMPHLVLRKDKGGVRGYAKPAAIGLGKYVGGQYVFKVRAVAFPVAIKTYRPFPRPGKAYAIVFLDMVGQVKYNHDVIARPALVPAMICQDTALLANVHYGARLAGQPARIAVLIFTECNEVFVGKGNAGVFLGFGPVQRLPIIK